MKKVLQPSGPIVTDLVGTPKTGFLMTGLILLCIKDQERLEINESVKISNVNITNTLILFVGKCKRFSHFSNKK